MEGDKKSMESFFASVKNTSVPLTLRPPPPPPGRQDWGNSSTPSPAATMSQLCIGEVLGFPEAHSLSRGWLLCPFARPWSLSMRPYLCLSFCVCVCARVRLGLGLCVFLLCCIYLPTLYLWMSLSLPLSLVPSLCVSLSLPLPACHSLPAGPGLGGVSLQPGLTPFLPQPLSVPRWSLL